MVPVQYQMLDYHLALCRHFMCLFFEGDFSTFRHPDFKYAPNRLLVLLRESLDMKMSEILSLESVVERTSRPND